MSYNGEICEYCGDNGTMLFRLTIYYGSPCPGIEIILACGLCAIKCQRGGYRHGYTVVFGEHPAEQLDDKAELSDHSRMVTMDTTMEENIVNRRETRIMVGLAPKTRGKSRRERVAEGTRLAIRRFDGRTGDRASLSINEAMLTHAIEVLRAGTVEMEGRV